MGRGARRPLAPIARSLRPRFAPNPKKLAPSPEFRAKLDWMFREAARRAGTCELAFCIICDEFAAIPESALR